MTSKEKKQPETRDDSSKSEMMRRFKTQPFLFVGTVIILVIVIVAFVFVPALVPNTQMGGELIFGYYNKVPIKYVQNNYFAQVLENLNQYQNLSTDNPEYLNMVHDMWRMAFESTVVHMGILDEMKQAGYEAPKDVVDREVVELPIFQENGRFSTARYRALDNNTQMTIWRQVREGAAVNTYMSDLANLRASSKEAAFVSVMASPRRSFDIAVFPSGAYPDSEIVSYAAANPALFRITHLSRITIESGERDARQILDSVKNGVSTFEDAARNNSKDLYAEKGGDMGILMAYELESEIGDEQSRETVINLPAGSMSDLVQVSSGWAFFRAEADVRPADTNDPSHLESIRSYILDRNYGSVEEWLLAEAEKFSVQAGEKGFSQAAAEGNITKRSFGPIAVNYGNTYLFGTWALQDAPELAGADRNQNFWKAAFSTPLNTLSEPLVIGKNVIVLFPLEEIVLDESELKNIEDSYPYWRDTSMETVYRSYFLDSEKLDNRFDEGFAKLWTPN